MDPIAAKLRGSDAANQRAIDDAMLALDATENKSKLGRQRDARCIAGHSPRRRGRPRLSNYYRSLNPDAHLMPVPMMNVINGGKHADSSVDMQEFMIVPLAHQVSPKRSGSARTSSTHWPPYSSNAAIRPMSATKAASLPTSATTKSRLKSIMEAVARAGYRTGHARLDCPRPGVQRILRRRSIRLRSFGQKGAQRRRDGAVLCGPGRPLPNRLNRGWPG